MRYGVWVVAAFLLMGCTATQKSAAVGTAAGAGLGAIIGHQSGNRDKGALIGGAVGAAGGYAVGKTREVTKFCPVDGKEFPESYHLCPEHGEELRIKTK